MLTTQNRQEDWLCELKYFHEDDTDNSTDIARTYVLLLYREDVDTLDQLCYIVAMTTDKLASMLPSNRRLF